MYVNLAYNNFYAYLFRDHKFEIPALFSMKFKLN